MESIASRIILVSYEKILSSPYNTFSQLFNTVELKGDINCLAKSAASTIDINNEGYHQESNFLPKFNIDAFSSNGLAGWCYFQACPQSQPLLTIRYKNRILDSIVCSHSRPDLIQKGHPSKNCGFIANFHSESYKDLDISKLKLFIGDSDYELPISEKLK